MKPRSTIELHVLGVLLLAAALACYHLNFGAAGLALLFAGAVVELWAWMRAIQLPPRAQRALITNRYRR
jgi:hypothetical protein